MRSSGSLRSYRAARTEPAPKPSGLASIATTSSSTVGLHARTAGGIAVASRSALRAGFSACVSQHRLRRRGQLDNHRRLSKEIDRLCDGAVDEGSEILEGGAVLDPPGSAGHETDALWVGATMQDRGDFAVLLVPSVSQPGQPGAVGGAEGARGSDANDQHVPDRR